MKKMDYKHKEKMLNKTQEYNKEILKLITELSKTNLEETEITFEKNLNQTNEKNNDRNNN